MIWLTLIAVLNPVTIEDRRDTAAIPQSLIDLFSLHEHRYTGGKYSHEPFYFRLFIPDRKVHRGRLPLVIWLHGAGAAELEESKHTGHLKHLLLIFKHPEARTGYPFYLLAMQMKEHRWFNRSGLQEDDAAAADDQLSVLMEIVSSVEHDFEIDSDRIYVCGVSAGGSGCWELVLRHPDRFAAVAPMASSFDDFSRANRLAGVPIWAFHSRHDDRTDPTPVRQMVRAINSAGGRAHLTEIDKSLHDCWVEAFQQYRLLDWLLSHRKGATAGWEPGYVPWTPWEWVKYSTLIIGPIAFVMTLYIAIRRELKRHKVMVQAESKSTIT